MCPLSDSIHAWSVGVPGRPKCWAIAHRARNSRVDPAVIWGPLSETASSTGCTSLTSGATASSLQASESLAISALADWTFDADRGRELLEETDHSIDRMAAETGFGTATSLRQHLRATPGVSPSANRRTFRGTAA